MKMRISAVCVSIVAGGCEGHKSTNDPVHFGPPSAEAEIRSAFAITGELPDIDTMKKYAKAQGIVFEDSGDRSLRYCGKGRDKTDLSMTIFLLGDKGRVPGQQNYVATYLKDGRVVCIETRHAYTSL